MPKAVQPDLNSDTKPRGPCILRGRQMSVTIICPNLKCRTILQVPDSVRGKKVRCRKCGSNLMVPAAHKPKKAPIPDAKADAEE